MMRKLIILEINEVPFRIFDHYIKTNPESTLTKILTNSEQYITNSTDAGELHPWSTWPTLYRGVDNTRHLIKDIGEDLSKRNLEYPPIWDILTTNNIESGVFASLHTYPLPKDLTNFSFLIPDPFANGPETHPKSITPFQDFNLSMTKKSGRSVDRGIDKTKAFKLAFTFPLIGLRFKTLLKVAKQLIDERVEDWKSSRRRTFQSVLAFDLFLKQLKKHKPVFVTYFSNHIASALHRYWAASFPEDYENSTLPKEWVERYKNEIPFCLGQLNNMVKDVHNFIKKNPDYKLVIASSMGQAATKAEMVTHELFMEDYEKFSSAMGIDIEPLSAMHPQYNMSVSEIQSDLFENSLQKLMLNGNPISYRRKDGNFFSIDLGYQNIQSFDVVFNGSKLNIGDLGLKVKSVDDLSGGTAYHVPEGTLYIYDVNDPVSNPERRQIDLREVAPAILEYFNIEKPTYMKQPSFVIS